MIAHPEPGSVDIVAVCGLPVVNRKFAGRDFTEIRTTLVEALGAGAVLTYGNPRGRTLTELGEMCLARGHLWTFRSLTLGLGFRQVPIAVRNAFAFDGRYHLSWVENEHHKREVDFTAQANLRELHKLRKRAKSKDWRPDQRAYFALAADALHGVFPDYFT